MEKRSTSTLADWLDGLARESWQLELLISGFAIFLLIGVYEPLREAGNSMEELNWQIQTFLGPPYLVAITGWFILVINLCVHVVLRGLWISTIGLRSVSDDIDFDALKLQPRFDAFLRRQIGSFDRYIERLERICSVLFAFTFLILFMGLSVAGMILLFGVVNLVLHDGLGLGNHWIVALVNIALLLGGILYFLDFVTLSRLKRVGRLQAVYYPIYRFYSLITFARLYRPLYYNLIDNRFGRGVGFLLLPYVLFLMVASSASLVTDTYFPPSPGEQMLTTDYYDDLRPPDTPSWRPGIPSRYVDNGFVELFIPYLPDTDDEVIREICPDLEVAQSTGLQLKGIVNISITRNDPNTDSLLLCMGNLHRIHVDDSLLAAPTFRFYTHPQRRDNGLLTVLDVAYLPRGEHQLRVDARRIRPDSVAWVTTATIPFWKE